LCSKVRVAAKSAIYYCDTVSAYGDLRVTVTRGQQRGALVAFRAAEHLAARASGFDDFACSAPAGVQAPVGISRRRLKPWGNPTTDFWRSPTARCARPPGRGKERQCPLWPSTVEELKPLIVNRSPAASVFLNRCGHPITRFGIHASVERYVRSVQAQMPSLAAKRSARTPFDIPRPHICSAQAWISTPFALDEDGNRTLLQAASSIPSAANGVAIVRGED